MRPYHTKPIQLDMFGLSEAAKAIPTPQWQTLSNQTRHRVTGLMARLLLEHATELGSRKEDHRLSLQSGKNGDV